MECERCDWLATHLDCAWTADKAAWTDRKGDLATVGIVGVTTVSASVELPEPGRVLRPTAELGGEPLSGLQCSGKWRELMRVILSGI